jgi:polysaccharide pyruvyl transferase WcaK-like protein
LSPASIRTNLKAWLKRSPLFYTIAKTIRQAYRFVLDGGRIFVGSRNAKSFRRWQDYFTAQPIAGYIGWLGYANLGDEAMYLSFEKLFPEFQIILSNDVHPIELILYRYLVKRRSFYEFIFLGGGTLINARRYLDALQSARLRDNKLIVFGTGVRDPSFWAEHYPQVDYSQEMADWVSVLQKAAFLSVRGPQSASILEAYGLPKPRIIGDPALSICVPRSPDSSGSHTIALNLGCSGPMWGKQEVLNEVIGRLSQQLLESGWQVEFLPMHPTDLRLGQSIIRTFNLQKASVWQEFRDIGKTLDRIRTYDLVVGQRLHSAVLACGCGVPAISLEYRPKCGDFMESIAMQKFAIRTDVVDVDKILALMDEINTNYTKHCQRLIAACDHLRQLQRQATEEVISL